MAASRPAAPRTATKPRPDRPIRISLQTNQGQPQNRIPPDRSKGRRKHHGAKNPHAYPYSVCPPMNSLMIDVGGIAAISSGESATI